MKRCNWESLGGLLFLIALAGGLGKMRHEMGIASSSFISSMHGKQSESRDSDDITFILLTLAFPLGIAYLWRKASSLREMRKETLQKQSIWKAKQDEMMRLRERHEELIRLISGRKDFTDRKREEAREEIRALQEQTQAEERIVRETLELERQFAHAYNNSLISRLHQYRYAFIEAACKAKKEYLIYDQEILEQPHNPSPVDGRVRLLPG